MMRRMTIGSPPILRVIDGGRPLLERELLRLIALDGDQERAAALMRQLEPAANVEIELVRKLSSGAVGSQEA